MSDTQRQIVQWFPGHMAKTRRLIKESLSLVDGVTEIIDAEFEVTRGMEQTGFDKDYLRRCFKKEVGKTPLEYLTSLRMEQAKTLLIQQTFSGVEAVATACGFSDPFYFSTCFKRHVGTSPLQYRKQNGM